MHRSYLFLLFILIHYSTSAQLFQNFDDNDLSAWSGDINDFIINDEFELQLMAENAGISTIYTSVSFPDSLIWNVDVKLSFSPSTSNTLKVLLGLDDIDLSIANGYYLEIGESGSDDAIHFYQLVDGNPSLIASGTMGQVANSFQLRFNLSKSSNDIWKLNITDLETNNFSTEFELFWDDSAIKALTLFGFEMEYTASRTDKFSFDNIEIKEIVADTVGPILLSVNTLAANKLEFVFDEVLDEASAKNAGNYLFNPTQAIDNIVIDDPESGRYCILLNDDLPSGQIVDLTVSGIEDVIGNVMKTQSFLLSLEEIALQGDLLVNEILFDPYTGGDDFVEIINVSNKTIDLDGLILRNADKGEDESIDRKVILNPGEIVAFTPNAKELTNIYLPPESANILNQEIPSFNNGDGNISLINVIDGKEVLIDAFDYREDMHFDLLSDTEGVSLERISLISDTNDPNNWFSSASPNLYATPGYENSARINPNTNGEEAVYLEYKVFSPDSDGEKDQLIINYNLDKAGYVANIKVFDDYGRFERNLAQNQLLSTQGFITWDGGLENNQVASVGMYIIYYDIFHPDGQVINGKKVCVLAQRLN